MVELIRGAFRGLFSVLVVILVIGVIIGGIIFMTNSPLLWFLGIVIGLILVICLTGSMATFLNIDENLEAQTQLLGELLKKNSSVANAINSSAGRSIVGNKLQKKCKSCHKEVDEDYSGCPYCGNNTFE